MCSGSAGPPTIKEPRNWIRPEFQDDFRLGFGFATHDVAPTATYIRSVAEDAMSSLSSKFDEESQTTILTKEETDFLHTLVKSLSAMISHLRSQSMSLLSSMKTNASLGNSDIQGKPNIEGTAQILFNCFKYYNLLPDLKLGESQASYTIDLPNSKFKFQGRSHLSLARIIFNLLFNAYKHSKSEDFSSIAMDIRLAEPARVDKGNNNFLVIQVSNKADLGGKGLDDLLNTMKNGKKRQGLPTIDAFCKKLGGELTLTDEDGTVSFTAKIPVKIIS